MFSEESLWSFLKVVFVVHENKQTISGKKWISKKTRAACKQKIGDILL
jgi:hypothetical protein